MVTKTAGPAFVWAGLALVELEGAMGPYEVEHVLPVGGAKPNGEAADQHGLGASRVA